MENNVLEQIEARMPSLSKSQKKIGEFILTHYDKAVFMTALKLGQQVNVSEWRKTWVKALQLTALREQERVR